MPIHPLDKDWRQSLREDREAFILADQLGYTIGLCGEHATDKAENITSTAIFIATLADATKRIKLGTGTINMPNSHPVAVASQIAMLDHLLDGRFVFGISPGGLMSDAEAFGTSHRPRCFLNASMRAKIWQAIRLQHQGQVLERRGRAQFARIGGATSRPLQRPSADRGDGGGATSRAYRAAALAGDDLGELLMPEWVRATGALSGLPARRPQAGNWAS
jgi:alkanesulfonate monooxygenase SsuD/methylene tetrahydromethanopterin reductase-like flavin-dependent oxidoreductase (luciferase family)